MMKRIMAELGGMLSARPPSQQSSADGADVFLELYTRQALHRDNYHDCHETAGHKLQACRGIGTCKNGCTRLPQPVDTQRYARVMQFGSDPSLRSGALAHFVRSVYILVDVASLKLVRSVGF
jgi:hypothetical protein